MISVRGHGAIVYCLNSESDDSQTGRHNVKESRCPIDNRLPVLKESHVIFLVLRGDNRNRTREAERDFGDLPIRRNEGRVVNTPWCLKGFFFEETKKKRDEREEPALDGERESPGWNGREESAKEKGLVRD
ncbi:hypothetical protein TNCV_204171 [Trichonephila clavipes]|nr:hypothetical protein TNCV_204171 [Trichonephila clavipes]